MDNSLKIFDYNGEKIRTVEKNSEVWFIAKDICDVLGIKNPTKAVSSLADDEKMTLTESYGQKKRGGARFYNIVNEPGLYRLIFRSNRPEAEQFKHWVFHEVLMDIHKHGMYLSEGMMEQLINNPVAFEQVATGYINSKYAPSDKTGLMVLGYSVHLSRTLFVVKEAANILRQFGLQIGEYKLWRMLREDGFACRHDGRRHNVPTQKGLDEKIVTMAFTGKTPLTMMTINGVRFYAQKLVLRDFPLLAS